jgi:DNA processing protein
MNYHSARALELLHLGTQNPSATFRDDQEDAIRHVVEGRGRLLVVQKTGWGKSAVYFIATKLLREQGAGPAILISPLLSLMRNQIAAAERMGVRAATIHSDNRDEWEAVEASLKRDEVDILLISPERLTNEHFRDEVLGPVAGRISLLVVDEAHCISDWGHDFRPHYRFIERIVRQLPANVRLLATTATANQRVSSNTQAILLLTAPLIAGKKEEAAPLLKPAEYNRLARLLVTKGKQPADLLVANAAELIDHCEVQFGQGRIKTLLGRGFLLSQAVDRWHSRGIWVISRADAGYPKRFKARLKENAPPILYGCGEPSLLELGGLAVVGSRHVDEGLKEYTMSVGAKAAEAGRPIISGAAKGIDSSAMAGALECGGMVIGVMADSLERAALAKGNREALREGRLALVSPYDPAAGFNVGHAMQRNKAIYAFADASLVVTSDFEKGGTWAGAIEQLEKYRFGPVFVRFSSASSKGNVALLQRGGVPWPEPHNGEELSAAIADALRHEAKQVREEQLGLRVCEDTPVYPRESETTEAGAAANVLGCTETPAKRLMDAVSVILCEVLSDAKSADEVAEILNVSKPQAQTWLGELVKSGLIEKLSKPVRFRVVQGGDRLL